MPTEGPVRPVHPPRTGLITFLRLNSSSPTPLSSLGRRGPLVLESAAPALAVASHPRSHLVAYRRLYGSGFAPRQRTSYAGVARHLAALRPAGRQRCPSRRSTRHAVASDLTARTLAHSAWIGEADEDVTLWVAQAEWGSAGGARAGCADRRSARGQACSVGM